MQLDSGAACSVIPHCTAKSLRLPIQPTNKRLCVYDGKPLPVTGQTQVSLEFNGAYWQQDFILVATPHKFDLFGWDVLSQEHNLVVTQDFCLLFLALKLPSFLIATPRTDFACHIPSLCIWNLRCAMNFSAWSHWAISRHALMRAFQMRHQWCGFERKVVTSTLVRRLVLMTLILHLFCRSKSSLWVTLYIRVCCGTSLLAIGRTSLL